MPDKLVEERDFEAGRRVFLLPHIQPHLPQAEQVEVVDYKARQEHDAESTEENCPQQILSPDRICLPDNLARHRAPLPVQQNQKGTANQYIRTAFNRLWHNFRPALLKFGARHDGMLNAEQSDQCEVDQKRGRCGRDGTDVDAPRNQKVTQKADQIQEGQKEYAVANDTI